MFDAFVPPQEVGIRDTLGGLILAGFLTVQVAGDMVARVVACPLP